MRAALNWHSDPNDEGSHGTGAVTRVLVTTSDSDRDWDTVGVHENIVAASWTALVDSVTYGLLHDQPTTV